MMSHCLNFVGDCKTGMLRHIKGVTGKFFLLTSASRMKAQMTFVFPISFFRKSVSFPMSMYVCSILKADYQVEAISGLFHGTFLQQQIY